MIGNGDSSIKRTIETSPVLGQHFAICGHADGSWCLREHGEKSVFVLRNIASRFISSVNYAIQGTAFVLVSVFV